MRTSMHYFVSGILTHIAYVLHSEIVIVILSAASLTELLHKKIEYVLLSAGSLVELPNEDSAIWSLQ